MKIAIDGPAGAGKSTIARKIASELGFVYIDTGAMYRALTWEALNKGINTNDAAALQKLALSSDIHFENGQQIYCNNINVTSDIRLPRITEAVSGVASHPAVREIMVEKQQDMALTADIVMDGRDIGECVLPDAEYKFFITASIEERARRRMKELQAKGIACDLQKIKNDIAARDQSDMQRPTGALKILDDSIIIDTSNLSIDEVAARLYAIIREG
ncbi:MAG TPA: (d)CMP kinase [Syntrophomonas sp.]|jgi:cytidylate kinase|nr:(d)CMP kinase [Syntrophomonas sp.]